MKACAAAGLIMLDACKQRVIGHVCSHLLLKLVGCPWLQDSDGVRTRARAKASTAGGGGGDADGFAAAKGFVDRRRDGDASAAQFDTVRSDSHARLGYTDPRTLGNAVLNTFAC